MLIIFGLIYSKKTNSNKVNELHYLTRDKLNELEEQDKFEKFINDHQEEIINLCNDKFTLVLYIDNYECIVLK